MYKDKTYKVIIKQYSPVEDAIILAGPFKMAEKADAIANQLSSRIALKENQYLAVLEEALYQESETRQAEECDMHQGLPVTNRNKWGNDYLLSLISPTGNEDNLNARNNENGKKENEDEEN